MMLTREGERLAGFVSTCGGVEDEAKAERRVQGTARPRVHIANNGALSANNGSFTARPPARHGARAMLYV